MAKFIFKLEGLLRQRKHIEQEKQRVLAQKLSHVAELDEALRKIQQTVQASNEEMRGNRLVGQLDMAFITAHRRFMGAMQRQVLALAQRITLAQRAMNEARAELIEAARRRKVIEKLREQQFLRWRENLSRTELAEQDEIGMQLAYQNLTDRPEPAA